MDEESYADVHAGPAVVAGIALDLFLFVLWVIVIVSPGWISFVKIYEEREIEIRFGASYLDCKATTAFL